MKKLVSFILVLTFVISCASMVNFTVFAKEPTNYAENAEWTKLALDSITNTDGVVIASGFNSVYSSPTVDILPAVKNVLGEKEKIKIVISFMVRVTSEQGYEGTVHYPRMLLRGTNGFPSLSVTEWMEAYEESLDGKDMLFRNSNGNLIKYFDSTSISEEWSFVSIPLSLYASQINNDYVVEWKFCFEEFSNSGIETLEIKNFAVYDCGEAPEACMSYKISDGEATITNCNPLASGDIYIPETFNGYPITCIGDNAFLNCTDLTSISIPATVKDIGVSVFDGCMGLTSITIDKNNVAYYAESNCIIEKATQKLITACNGCAIPVSIVTIGNSAFKNNLSLNTVIIPDSVKTIEENAFNGCSNLQQLIWGKGIISISNNAFSGCTGLKTVTFATKEQKIRFAALFSSVPEILCNEEDGKIYGAMLEVGSTLTINYYADIDADALNALMLFTSSSGRKQVVGGVFDLTMGLYKFAYTEINPQCMNDTIKAELYVDNKLVDTKENYSVKAYCENQISRTASELSLTEIQYAILKTLLADMLVYGAEAQKYKNYNTSNLPDTSAWVSEYKSEFEVPNGVKNMIGNNDANNRIKSAGLNMSNVNKIFFKFAITDTDIVITLNDNIIDRKTLVKENGLYVLYSDDIKATQFADIYTLKLIKNEEVISTVEYNVNAYIQSKHSAENVGKIVKALANYGNSARRYQSSFNDKNFDLDDDIL